MTSGGAILEAFRLRALHEADRFGTLKTGHPAFAPLKSFARSKAHKYEASSLARTYVIEDVGVGRIAAFITLACSEVASKGEMLVEDEGVDFPYAHYPAVKIARLLVDARYRGDNPHGFGLQLVDFALGIARSEICPAVGCRFVVVDSKQESIGFYAKCGFTLVDTAANRARGEPVMFLDLHKAGLT